jgi:GrpB-like predicted nucleotidyltransferase (UPF0157 family)
MTVPNPVEIFEYDPDWPVQFERIRRAISSVLGDVALSIEHVGSTSVPGLAAKPILDIDVVVRTTADVPNAIELLASIGYTHQGDLGIPGREAFTAPDKTYQQHLYLLASGAKPLEEHITLRDRLRADRNLVEQYAEIKYRLASEYGDDREGYTEAKTEFIRRVLAG